MSNGMYQPSFEHDACGVGFVVNINGAKTHDIIEKGLKVITNLIHRGAVGGDANTGDGAGILTSIPHDFFIKECARTGIDLPDEGFYGVGMFFLSEREKTRQMINEVLREEGLSLLGWREVPVDPSCLGEKAKAEQPAIEQCFVGTNDRRGFDRKLYVARRVMESRSRDFFVCSFSPSTIVYKGLFLAHQVGAFYADLRDPDFKSPIAVVHQRYSTNTFPNWKLAHPFRFLAHNGEINTLSGNRMHMAARERTFQSELFGDDIRKIIPVLDPEGSDSMNLDQALELLHLSGRSLAHSMMMLIPEAYGEKYPMGPDKRAFFEYHSGLMEPWDGPAAAVFSDGTEVGAVLDRNGLRPARYTITRDGFMVLASETGVLPFNPEEVEKKGALRPGEMVLVDTKAGRVLYDDELKTWIARRQPFRRWIEENKITLEGLFDSVIPVAVDEETLLLRQRMFGYTREDIRLILTPMAETGNEPVGSMGNDTPLAVLSERPQLLYSYFKQLFAQVTNPPIDPIREELVMSTSVFIGNKGNILQETPRQCRLVKLKHPILRNIDIERLRNFREEGFRTKTLPLFFRKGGNGKDLEAALDELCESASKAVGEGFNLIILSDRDVPENQSPIPALLAVAALNHHLIRRGERTSAGLVVETGEAREVMHLALLLGYGATAVNPYLALETVTHLAQQGHFLSEKRPQKLVENYIQALRKGLMKIMSKMGIATLRSYRGAQVFEALGLHEEVIRRYFTGTASRISGLTLDGIAKEAGLRVERAPDPEALRLNLLPEGGQYAFRADGERRLFSPGAIALLQQAARNADREAYRKYASLINDQSLLPFTLRGLFGFRRTAPIPLEEVEPAVEIMKRFAISAMSFGSLGREVHETIAMAMNRIGGRSNSGEGGEDPARYRPAGDGGELNSAVKQVASGRFGVTIEYLASAREIQIKIAQGAKPGEGGQLPGHKVNDIIARVRHSTPGVTLISPPPHHDIYSIEDLSQLIYDLKCANPDAEISVKLVSEAGVGTVAAGVAKGKADRVLISGHDGGTGASPLSSIRYAGLPWELGLAETQQTLVLNGLRDRIHVQVDGQIKTGRDAVVAALLGAESFGIASAALVSLGCVMMRKCHLNTCPMGVATQDPRLRALFKGRPEHLINIIRFMAEEVRETMAGLGFRRFDDMVGRSDLLEKTGDLKFWKTENLDFSRIFNGPRGDVLRCAKGQAHDLKGALDWALLAKAEEAVRTRTPLEAEMDIANVHRSTGALLSGRIVKAHGIDALAEDQFKVHFKGCAGQSFGAFLARGVTFTLEGEANDYLGKGLSGGKIIVRPPRGSRLDPSENVIAGNTLLYGATSGEVYINGRAGERFAVRNSGATAVVEGVGEHGCEYMTGGRVVVLGETGLNFAAGMSGGIAYVFDEHHRLDSNSNLSMIDLDAVVSEEDVLELRGLIQNHLRYTGSPRAGKILGNWSESLFSFVKVFPIEYKQVLGKMTREDLTTRRERALHA